MVTDLFGGPIRGETGIEDGVGGTSPMRSVGV